MSESTTHSGNAQPPPAPQTDAATVPVGASLRMPYRIAEPWLDSQRLTVLGVLISVGLSGGLGAGEIVGGLLGAGLGVSIGVGLPVLLAIGFRHERTRVWLRRLADWAVGRSGS